MIMQSRLNKIEKNKSLTFMEGVIIALIASFVGSIGYFTLSTLFSEGFAIRLLVSGLSLAYIFYLLSRSKERVGRLSTVLLWSIITVALWLSASSIMLFVLSNIFMTWLIRSLYFYSSLLSSAVDLFLNGFSLAAGVWAFVHTDSIFLGIWCLFLIQALFVFIPARFDSKRSLNTSGIGNDSNENDNNAANFQQAYRDAEAAVRKLSIH